MKISISVIMQKGHNLSIERNTENIIKRCNVLKKLLDTKTDLKRIEIITYMQKNGYKTYNTRLLSRDNTILNRNSTFIKDLLQSNFSAYIEDIYKKTQWIEDELYEIYRINWNNNKTIITQTINDGSIIELVTKHKTSPIAGPKIQALALMAKIQELKHTVVTGDNLQLSAALLGQKFIQMQKELNVLRKLKKRRTFANLE